MNVSLSFRRLLLRSLGVGVALNLLVFAWVFSNQASRMETFRQVHVGMSRRQARILLADGRIMCGITWGIRSNDCTFSDFWRDYLIELDDSGDHVRHTYYRYKKRNPLSFHGFE